MIPSMSFEINVPASPCILYAVVLTNVYYPCGCCHGGYKCKQDCKSCGKLETGRCVGHGASKRRDGSSFLHHTVVNDLTSTSPANSTDTPLGEPIRHCLLTGVSITCSRWNQVRNKGCGLFCGYTLTLYADQVAGNYPAHKAQNHQINRWFCVKRYFY